MVPLTQVSKVARRSQRLQGLRETSLVFPNSVSVFQICRGGFKFNWFIMNVGEFDSVTQKGDKGMFHLKTLDQFSWIWIREPSHRPSSP
jgi:hypothetical protein